MLIASREFWPHLLQHMAHCLNLHHDNLLSSSSQSNPDSSTEPAWSTWPTRSTWPARVELPTSLHGHGHGHQYSSTSTRSLSCMPNSHLHHRWANNDGHSPSADRARRHELNQRGFAKSTHYELSKANWYWLTKAIRYGFNEAKWYRFQQSERSNRTPLRAVSQPASMVLNRGNCI